MSDDTSKQDVSEVVVDELRMALAMSGGISLVLYQSGVAHELERFVRAWRVAKEGESEVGDEAGYVELFKKGKLKPVVDVLTGASAGGINGILLGNCIVHRKPFAPFRDLWVKELDTRKMRYGDDKSTRMSLYRVDNLLERAKVTIRSNFTRKPGDYEPSLGLRVRLAWTHLLGHCVTTKDALGHSIQIDGHASYASFDEADFLDESKTDVLVRAGQATSAFPVAFPPVRHNDRWYIDGGLQDNQPIDLAIDAIRDKPAYARTHRVVLFIDPDPTVGGEASSNEVERPIDLGDVVLALPFMGLKGSILPAILEIQSTNARYTQYQELLENPSFRAAAEAQGRAWLTTDRQPLRRRRRVSVLLDGDPALVERWQALERGGLADFLRKAEEEAEASLHNVDLVRRRLRREIQETNKELKETNELNILAGDIAYKKDRYWRLDALNHALAIPEASREADPVKAVLKDPHAGL